MQVKVYIIICILIYSKCYVLNFMLPAYRPNFADVNLHNKKSLGRPAVDFI
jgi:hypothetical protein